MIKILFKKLNTTILGGAILISFFSVISKILGLIRDRILASFFGAGEVLDAYFASFRIPDLIFNTLVLGALASAFVPIFVKLNRKDKQNADYVSSSILNILTTILILIALIVIIKAKFFVKLLVPGFNLEQLALTVKLTRIMLLSIIIFGASNVMSSLLNSYKSYFFYSLAPVAYNLGIIIGVVLSNFYGYLCLAWGVVLGSLLHFIIQFLAVVKSGWKYSFVFDFKNIYVQKIFKLMLPRTLGLAIMQINQVVITMIASNLIAGSIAVFYFGLNLQSAVVGIFGISIAIAVFPVLSEYAHDSQKFVSYLVHKIKKIIFLVIPISVLIIILRTQIVRIILGSGNFDWQDTYYTAQVLGYFALSLVFQCLTPLLARAFYALENTKTPVITSIFSFILNIILALYLSPRMGIEGVALAFSITSILNLLLLIFFIYQRFLEMQKYKLAIFTFKVIVNSIIMGLFVYLSRNLLVLGINTSKFIGIFLQLSFSSVLGIILYFVLSIVTRLPEAEILKKYYAHFEKYLLGKMKNNYKD